MNFGQLKAQVAAATHLADDDQVQVYDAANVGIGSPVGCQEFMNLDLTTSPPSELTPPSQFKIKF